MYKRKKENQKRTKNNKIVRDLRHKYNFIQLQHLLYILLFFVVSA